MYKNIMFKHMHDMMSPLILPISKCYPTVPTPVAPWDPCAHGLHPPPQSPRVQAQVVCHHVDLLLWAIVNCWVVIFTNGLLLEAAGFVTFYCEQSFGSLDAIDYCVDKISKCHWYLSRMIYSNDWISYKPFLIVIYIYIYLSLFKNW